MGEPEAKVSARRAVVVRSVEKIYNVRLFYVLKPSSEDVVKFGIAGLTGTSSSWGRLHQYIKWRFRSRTARNKDQP